MERKKGKHNDSAMGQKTSKFYMFNLFLGEIEKFAKLCIHYK